MEIEPERWLNTDTLRQGDSPDDKLCFNARIHFINVTNKIHKASFHWSDEGIWFNLTLEEPETFLKIFLKNLKNFLEYLNNFVARGGRELILEVLCHI